MKPAWALLMCITLAVGHVGGLLLPSPTKQPDFHNPLERVNVLGTTILIDNEIQMQVNTTTLTGARGDWVEVSWHGVNHPSHSDWVALLVPAHADATNTAPAKYRMAAEDVDKTHLREGRGRLRFHLINYRVPMQFLFFRGGLLHPVLAARGPVVTPSNPNQPLQRRLALTGDNTQMRVEWTTKSSKHPVVKWGTAPGVYTHTTAASSGTFTRHDMCGPPANSTGWLDPGVFHSAVLEGLEPGMRYYYVVGDEEHGFSPEASFTAAPLVGPGTHVKLLALADLGQAEQDGSMESEEYTHSSLNTTSRIIAELQAGADYQLLVHPGDISYARGYATQWDNYHHQVEPIISTMPYMTQHGNHERDYPNTGDRFNWAYDSGGECGVQLERRFTMPQAGPDKPWYSFDFGPIHFLQYSTEHDFAPGSEQHSWVLADLAAVDRRQTPWVVVAGHRPLYICSVNDISLDGDQSVAAEIRAAFEEVFVKYKVDLTLHGHHHTYQRTCPVIAGECQTPTPSSTSSPSDTGTSGPSSSSSGSSSSSSGRFKGRSVRGSMSSSAVYVDAPAPVHLVIGNAGAELTPVASNPEKIWEAIKVWWGFTRIEADGSQLKVEAVSDSDGAVMDTLTLVKSEGWAERHMQAMKLAQQREPGRAARQGLGTPWRQWWRLWQWAGFRSAALQEE